MSENGKRNVKKLTSKKETRRNYYLYHVIFIFLFVAAVAAAVTVLFSFHFTLFVSLLSLHILYDKIINAFCINFPYENLFESKSSGMCCVRLLLVLINACA